MVAALSPALRLSARLVALLLLALGTLTGLSLLLGQTAPAGPQLAFFAYAGDQGAIYLHDFDRSLSVPLHRTAHQVVTLGWSPDGRQLAFVEFDQGYYFLYALSVDERTTRRLTDRTASTQRIHWSPDGERIAFLSQGAGDISLYLLASQGGEPLLALQGWLLGLAWSPDGEQLAVGKMTGSEDAVPGIYVLPSDCSADAQPCLPAPLADHQSSARMPSWSPDGTRIAFLSDQAGSWQVYTLDAACIETPATCTSTVDRLTFAPAVASTTVLLWSPDSRWLAFEGWPNGVGASVYLVDTACPGCADSIRTVSDLQDTAFVPAWSADGRWLAYVARRPGESRIDVIDTTCLERGTSCAPSARSIRRAGEVMWFPTWRPVPAPHNVH